MYWNGEIMFIYFAAKDYTDVFLNGVMCGGLNGRGYSTHAKKLLERRIAFYL